MFVASNVILAALQSEKRNSAGELIFEAMSAAEKAVVRTHDLMVIRNPYVVLGLVVIAMIVVFLIAKMPNTRSENPNTSAVDSIKRLVKNKLYRQGVIAQVFYVGVQIMCWTFIIHYAENLGISKATAQRYNMVAMALFISFRFVSTFLMRYFNSRLLLLVFALGGMISIVGTIFIQGMGGLYCLIATSAFMSLMFPTIYGISLEGIGEDATLGAAGLVMAIVGGALMPPLQGMIIDLNTVFGLPAVNFSFILPLICFVVIARFGLTTLNMQKTTTK